MTLERHVIEVCGRVQGVGFRPHVAREAQRLGLVGSVANVANGVRIDVQGERDSLVAFERALDEQAPPRAEIEALRTVPRALGRGAGFSIAPSAGGGSAASIAHDSAPCGACLAELFDPSDARFRYPFVSCADCGPRYAVLRDTPWDRANTTMAGFTPCARCHAEMTSPSDRRYHAQTHACPDCGPRLELLDASACSTALGASALDDALAVLGGGGILALKGLGGFQLLCDAGDAAAIGRLRARKGRPDKPFAVMLSSLAALREHADPSPTEVESLRSCAAPIVLLRRRRRRQAGERAIVTEVAPASPLLGLMLPATPLHHLIARGFVRPLVVTSGNRSGEPMAITTVDAVERLSGIADAWLTHDRPIARALDDSVLREIAGEPMALRRGRGLAPLSLDLANPVETPCGPVRASAAASADEPSASTVLALGGDGKAALCMAVRDGMQRDRAVLGEHLGDIASPRARERLATAVRDIETLQRAVPTALAIDAHPDYASARFGTRLAGARGVPVYRVAHHVAHVLAVAAEHRIDGPVLGFAWDGAGFGGDAEVRGSECLVMHGTQVRRIATLQPFRLPGGDAAAREPRRAALGLLHAWLGDAVFDGTRTGELGIAPPADGAMAFARHWLHTAFAVDERAVFARMMSTDLNTPWSSSAGRLFDGLAALLDLVSTVSFEGQAAQRLEHAADEVEDDPERGADDGMLRSVPDLRCDVRPLASPAPSTDDSQAMSRSSVLAIDWRPMIEGALAARADGVPVGAIAAAAHVALIEAMVTVARAAGLPCVVLGGGCFQNRRLAEGALAALTAARFQPVVARRVPPNDGGLALGQAVFAQRAAATGECACV